MCDFNSHVQVYQLREYPTSTGSQYDWALVGITGNFKNFLGNQLHCVNDISSLDYGSLPQRLVPITMEIL